MVLPHKVFFARDVADSWPPCFTSPPEGVESGDLQTRQQVNFPSREAKWQQSIFEPFDGSVFFCPFCFSAGGDGRRVPVSRVSQSLPHAEEADSALEDPQRGEAAYVR